MHSVDTYMQDLEKIAKTCNFTAVNAEENKKQYIRDAFINGISSSSIRQRLLENCDLTLEEVYRRARALEQAQRHSASFESNIVAAVTEFNDTNSHEKISAIQKEKKV